MTAGSADSGAGGSDQRPPGRDGTDPTNGDVVARTDGVSHAFGDLQVLADVSVTVPARSATAVIGPNGSGKTTLLRIVGGLLRSTAGAVSRPAAEGRTVGFLPQSPGFRPTYTVRETVTFYADLLPGAVDVDATLDRVGMTGTADRRVGALSGGMTRLLGLAVAVLGDPPLVVLDEPTGDLDPLLTDHIFGVIDELADERAVVLATHDLRGAATADRLVVLDRGRVAASGPIEEVLAGEDVTGLPELFRAVVASEEAVVSAGGVGG